MTMCQQQQQQHHLQQWPWVLMRQLQKAGQPMWRQHMSVLQALKKWWLPEASVH